MHVPSYGVFLKAFAVALLAVGGVWAGEPAQLEAARENVRISREAERQVREKLTKEKDAEKAREYKAYLKRLESITYEYECGLWEMEKALSNHVAQTGTTLEEYEDDGMDWKLPEEPEFQEGSLEAMEREFRQSLAEYDEFLLNEQTAFSRDLERIVKRTSENVEKLRRESETISKVDVEREQKETTFDSSERNSDTDDVVARQLREAAEAETDPEIKRLLWKEYDEYKASVEQ